MKLQKSGTTIRAIAFLIVLIFFLQSTSPALACGPSFLEPLFVLEKRPDFPRTGFIAGSVGIVNPKYARSNLFVAYRYLNDLPLSAEERRQVENFWRKENAKQPDAPDAMQEAVRNWVETRAKVTDELPPGHASIDRKGFEFAFYMSLEKKYKGYVSYVNCAQNALEVAAETLQNRIAAHGAENESVKEWLKGQDAVFSNCSQIKTVPAGAPDAAPLWLKNDRAYQIAAANFYVENYDEARTGFQRIAENQDSEWRELSDYLVGRTLIRQASFAKTATESKSHLEEAEAHLRTVVAKNTRYRRAAQKLLNLAAIRLRPEERTAELSRSLLETNSSTDLGQDLTDYVYLLDRFETQALDKLEEGSKPKEQPTPDTRVDSNAAPTPSPNPYADEDYPRYYGEMELKQENIPAPLLEEDLSDWIFNYQLSDRKALEHAAERWRGTGKAHWLMSVLAKLDAKTPETVEFLTAAEKVSRASKAFPTIAFHSIRLFIEQGENEKARRKLDSILADSSLGLPRSAQNQFLQQRMFLAQNLDDFLRFAPRRAVAFVWNGSNYEDFPTPQEGEDYLSEERKWADRLMLDEYGRQIFEKQIPLAVLLEAVKSPRLPDYLKRQLSIAGWTRAVLLENHETGREFAILLARQAPEMSEVLKAYADAANPNARRNAALYAVLKFPAFDPYFRSGMGRLTPAARIDSYRDNWWCGQDESKPYDYNNEKSSEAPRLRFLSDAQIASAEAERVKLKAAGYAPNYLAARTIEWANSAPSDARLPEALHLAVRTTRYGCNGENIGTVSKAAYDILHKRFPNSEWAKRTPYWYKQ